MNEMFRPNPKSNEILSSLSEEKRKLIEKYSLQLTERMMWVTMKENSFPKKICRHAYLEKSDIMGLLFRVNEICFAKVNYFRLKQSSFEPCIYHYANGFTATEMWNADFLKHKASGFIIDLRYLNTIREIEKFREFCAYLEGFEK
jgi:hypothetical protein